ncbi:hypothetical protein AEYBE204_05295 [Asticcacaulis sp. YBE204]|nr:hypothetical protein AEYBE204_05295 [Asticcacaulis sp. YBE204]
MDSGETLTATVQKRCGVCLTAGIYRQSFFATGLIYIK